MKVLIIEDEQPAAQKLVRLLHDFDEKIGIVGILESVEESTNWLSHNPHPDIIFMDVQLEDGICFEIFEKITIKTPVIFTTAFDKYAIKAFEVNSVDYLLKPVEAGVLGKAIHKYESIHRKAGLNIEDLVYKLQPKTKERFLIRVGEHFKSLQATDIYCFYIRERCNFIHTVGGKEYAFDYSLDKTEKMIDDKRFFRVNRDTIINYSAIKDVIAYSSNRLKIIMKDWPENNEILVSRERVAAFKKWMD
jgi:two-component system response regulator LytT